MLFKKDGNFKNSVYNTIIKKKDKKSMKKRHLIWLITLLAATLLLCLACTGNNAAANPEQSSGTGDTIDNRLVESDEISIVTPEPDLHREELDAILKRATMLDGVTINGVSVGGMTLEEARNAVAPSVDAKKQALSVTVTLGDASETFSSETVSVTDNFNEVLSEAFNLVREDNGFEAVSAEVENIRANGRDFPVTVAFEENALRSAVDVFADANETKPIDAAVGYNKEENKIDFTPDVTGRVVDRDALVEALQNANAGDTVEAPAVETPAAVTLADVEKQYVLRSSYTTSYKKSIKNRKYNIYKGAGMITGTILHPGDTFSANGTLGVRNKANGWKVATAYVAGAHEKQYGGGVCQLSSTLYNAAVLADMEIVDRRNHSMPVDYVSKGRDATINSIGNIIDFKFKNSSKSDIIIISYVDNTDYSKAGKLTMEIWGIPISEDSNGEYDEIRIPDPVKTKTLKPSGDVEYRVDETKPAGYKETLVKNQNGSVWESKKEYYLNGVLVKTENLATSTYKAFKAVYIVGPDATPAPTASATAAVTPSPSSGPSDPDPTPTPHSDPDPTPTPHSDPDPTPTPHSDPDPTSPSDGGGDD